MRERPFMTVKEVAELFGKDPQTIRHWIAVGRLSAYQPVPRGQFMIPRPIIDESGVTQDGHSPKRAARTRKKMKSDVSPPEL